MDAFPEGEFDPYEHSSAHLASLESPPDSDEYLKDIKETPLEYEHGVSSREEGRAFSRQLSQADLGAVVWSADAQPPEKATYHPGKICNAPSVDSVVKKLGEKAAARIVAKALARRGLGAVNLANKAATKVVENLSTKVGDIAKNALEKRYSAAHVLICIPCCSRKKKYLIARSKTGECTKQLAWLTLPHPVVGPPNIANELTSLGWVQFLSSQGGRLMPIRKHAGDLEDAINMHIRIYNELLVDACKADGDFMGGFCTCEPCR